MARQAHLRGLPRWLKPLNKVLVAVHRSGVPIEGLAILTVPGRRSGRPVTNPVTPMHIDKATYLVGFPGTHWVANARVSPNDAELATGRHRRNVELVELPTEERPRVLREFPKQVPLGTKMMIRAGHVKNGTPEEFEAIADKCVVFRVDPR